MPFRKACNNCRGSGAEVDSKMIRCPKCRGSGMTERRVSSGFFVQISREPCRHCQMRGQIPQKKCKTCRGSGKSKDREVIKVKIPQGIDERQPVRVQGKGKPSGDGGMPGDLIFRIRLKEHGRYERNGLDVYQRLFVDYPTFVLGGIKQVSVISAVDHQEFDSLKIPSGSQLNDVLTIKNRGFISKIRGNIVKGDSHYVLTLQIPKKTGKRAKELLKELQLLEK